MIIHVLVGLSGSGKSSYARGLDDVWISHDEFRRAVNNPKGYLDETEPFVLELMERTIEYWIENQKEVVIDGTNVNKHARKRWIDTGRRLNAKVIIHSFHRGEKISDEDIKLCHSNIVERHKNDSKKIKFLTGINQMLANKWEEPVSTEGAGDIIYLNVFKPDNLS